MTRPNQPDRISRRDAIVRVGSGIAAAGVLAGQAVAREGLDAMRNTRTPLFSISLAEWSLHDDLGDGKITNLDFPAEGAAMGFGAIEYVSGFFKDKARDTAYIAELNARANDAGTTQLLIMIDGEGRLGAPDGAERGQAIDQHVRWLEAARALGCHSIRVNAASEGSFDDQLALAADGLRRLTEIADGAFDLNVIVENHGGLSSNGAWLASVMRRVDHPRCGTLPDFGNFCLDWSRADDPDAWYDRYQGVEEMMPFAKAVSAKSHDFDAAGNEVNTDYRRMLGIVVAAGYSGYVGVEYEGQTTAPREGCRLTRALLERVRDELTE